MTSNLYAQMWHIETSQWQSKIALMSAPNGWTGEKKTITSRAIPGNVFWSGKNNEVSWKYKDTWGNINIVYRIYRLIWF